MVECAGRMWRVIRGKGEGERSRMRIDEEEEMKSERKDFSENFYLVNKYIYETIGSREKREIRKDYSKTGNELTRGERGNTSVMKCSKGVIQREKERKKKRRSAQTGVKRGKLKSMEKKARRGERREKNKGGGRTVKATNDSEDRRSVEAKRGD